jgi:hypothetical protein
MKKPAVNIFLMLAILVASIFLIKTSFALWSHKAAVGFTLNISQPQEEECCCGSYQTIIEGIAALRNKYDSIYNRMVSFEEALQARERELNELPPGGITKEKFEKECEYYKDVIKKFGDEIMDKYKNCCLKVLDDFYKNSSEEEKNLAEQQAQEEYGMSLEALFFQLDFKHLKDKLNDLEDWVKKVEDAGKEKEI